MFKSEPVIIYIVEPTTQDDYRTRIHEIVASSTFFTLEDAIANAINKTVWFEPQIVAYDIVNRIKLNTYDYSEIKEINSCLPV